MGGWDLLERDRRNIDLLLAQLEHQAEAAPRHVLDAAERQVSRHLATTLQALYPTVRRTLDGGDDAAKRARLGYEEIQVTMERIQLVPLGTEDFRLELGRYVAAVRQHLGEEIATVAALRAALPADELARLDGHLQRSAAHAPTRAHPHVLKSAAGAAVANRMLGVADRVRDRLHC